MTKTKYFLIIFLFLILTKNILAQKESWNWCFYYHNGITFNTPDTTPKYFDGVTIESLDWYLPVWGYNSISDSEGNLLFYTGTGKFYKNGNVYFNFVRNKSHKMVENSAEKNSPNPSTYQYLLPYPGKKNLIINLKLNVLGLGRDSGSYYNIVYDIIDINANNGEGKVISKNNFLTGTSLREITSMIVTRHSNRLYYWIHVFSDWDHTLTNYLFTGTNLIDSTVYGIGNSMPGGYSWKFSKNGRYTFSIFATYSYIVKTPYGEFAGSDVNIKLIDFDNKTGKMSSRNIKLCDSCGGPRVLFASDGKKFYTIEYTKEKPNQFFHYTSTIYQYTISNNIRQIERSKKQVAPTISDFVLEDKIWPEPPDPDGEQGLYDELRLGPDNKIYIGRNLNILSSLSNIDSPAEDVVFTDTALVLKHTAYGLPYILNDYYNVNLELSADTAVCEGDPITLSANISDTLYSRHYHWTGPDGFVSDKKEVIIPIAKKENAGWYIMEATVNGAKLYDSIYVDVLVLPRPEISGPQSAYLYQTKTYTTPNPLKELNIWYVEGGEIIGKNYLDSVVIRWTSRDTGKVILDEFKSEGVCKKHNELLVTLSDWPLPTITGNNEVCLNDTCEYETYADTNMYYIWKVNKGKIIKNNENNITINWNEIGNGTISLYTTNKLINRSDTARSIIIVNPNPPKPKITKEGQYLVIKEYDMHQWYINGKKIIGGTRHFYKPTESGQYRVRVIDSNGCKSELSDPFDLILDVESEIANGVKIISPNPAGDYIDISTNAVILNEVKNPVIKIYDVLGVVHLRQSATATSAGGGQVRIDISGLAAGVYFVRVGDKVLKFVKM